MTKANTFTGSIEMLLQMKRMKPKFIAIVSGVIWTVIAAFILQNGDAWGRIRDVRWWACVAGPVVGLAAYHISRWSYQKNIGVRIIWAVISLYLASGLYGLILGMLDMFHPLRSPDAGLYTFYRNLLPIWWGLTFLPVLWPLFLLSYFNHWLVARYDKAA